MYKVFVGGISPEGEHILNTYLEVFMPDAQIEPLKAVGIKGKMKNHAKRQDVALVILDEGLWQACVGVADDVLALPKVHKYVDDDGLNQFLISKFGRLDGVDVNESITLPPDMLDNNQEDNLGINEIPLPEEKEDTGVASIVAEDKFDNLAVPSEESDSDNSDDTVIADLQNKLAKSELLVRNLTMQLKDKNGSDDTSELIGRIHELEDELAKKDEELQATGENEYVALGKVARAEQIITEYDSLKTKLRESQENKSALEHDKTLLTDKVKELTEHIDNLETKLKEIDVLNEDIESKQKSIDDLTSELASKSDEISAKSSEIEQLHADIGVLQAQISEDKARLSELDDISKNLTEKQREYDDLVIDLDSKQKKLDSVTSEATRLKEDLDKKVVAYNDLASILASKESELNAKVKEISRLEESLSASQVSLDDANKEIERLTSELSSKSTELSNKEHDLSDSQTSLDNSNKEIERLTSELNSKNTELSNKEAELSKVVEKSTNLGNEINSLQNEITSLRESISGLEGAIKEKDAKISEGDSTIKDLNSRIESMVAKIEEYKSTIESNNKTINDLKSSSSDSSQVISSLKEELRGSKEAAESLSSKVEFLNNELRTNSDAIASLNDKLLESKKTIESLNNTIKEDSNTIESLSNTIKEDSNTIESLNNTIKEDSNTIESLNNSIKDKDSTISDLSKSVDDYKSQLADLSQKESTYKAKIDKLNVQLASLSDKDSEIESQSEALNNAIADKKALEDKLAEAESARGTLKSKLTEVQDSLVSVEAEKEKLKNRIEQLESDLNKSEVDDATVSKLESDLLEERRKTARLTSEVEDLKKKDVSDKVSTLQTEVSELKDKLKEARASKVSSKDLESLKEELQNERQLRSSLELDIVDRDEQLRELNENVFVRMANVAMPKYCYDISVSKLGSLSDKFYCVASGSNESNLSLYQELRKSCSKESKKRILILDLVVDSCIDREFGIQRINTPVDWLLGKESFKGYISNTRYNNVKVISTALAYLNDLYLLSVDWKARLSELEGFNADVIVLNVGCLNNTVSRVLFNTFSHSMKSYVIAKATPVNLRTVYLNMTGYKDISPNVTIQCVNFDDKASKNMYQKLVTKYKAQILRDSDFLKL